MPKLTVQYFAVLREQRGLSEEVLETTATTPNDLYRSLKEQHKFSLETNSLRVAVNDEFSTFDQILKDGDSVVFITPVAGG